MSVVIYITIIATLLVIISALYWSTGKHKLFEDYFKAFSAVGILLVIVSFIYNYQQQSSNIANTKLNDDLALTNSSWIDIENMFMEYYPYLSRLYHQMFPNPLNAPIPTVTDEQQEQNRTIHAIQIILQIMENVVTSKGGSTADWNDDSHKDWLNIFRQWFSSPILRNGWNVSQRLYGRDTIAFLNRWILPYVS